MKNRSASLANVLGVIVCVAVAASLVPRTILKQRVQARSSACSSNLKTIGLAFHNYHAAYKQLPAGTGGTTGNDDPAKSNQGLLGPLVGLLPFCEQQRLWEQVSNPYENKRVGVAFPPMGPIPLFAPAAYEPWGRGPDIYRCPESHPRDQAESTEVIRSLQLPITAMGVTASYVASYGDGTVMQGKVIQGRPDANEARNRRAANRGAFMTSQSLKFRDFLDGLSNTIFYSEVVSSQKRDPGVSEIVRDVRGLSKVPAYCLRAAEVDTKQFWEFGRGSCWADGRPVYTGFQTVLPPNSPSCTSEHGMEEPLVSATSLHADGVHVLIADGSVIFITDDIDAGDPAKAGAGIGPDYLQPGMQSPYGLWGALGTRANAETNDVQFPQATSRPRSSNRAPMNASVWTDKTRGAQLTAEFIEIKDQKTIRLKHASGTIHEVPLHTLIPSDIYRAIEIDVMRKNPPGN
ncbi:DUF1559 domain-containing protein [Stieleria sp. ICT_E10.1]|uniref:DUF1559 family PulG-like putative transporter n=1 Tax=Stieleria sedimenti TaxID=2976331 RepID=UPI0021808343|nr:DUF1559 domain-containing protein [Stieleria sedimenti]MCS7466640.1 DUF1559 domain-containing protein [Stieleria sedimenti]